MVDVHARLRQRILVALGASPLALGACDVEPESVGPGHATPGVRPPEPVAHDDGDAHEHGLGDHVHRYAPDRASQGCLDQYSRDKGFGLGDGLDTEDLAARCMDAIGEEDHCDIDGLISEEAARCIADVKGLEPGVEPWKLTLVVDRGHQEIIWNVTSVTSKGEYGVRSKSVQIDADSGEHLIGGADHKGGRPLYGDGALGTGHVAAWAERTDWGDVAGSVRPMPGLDRLSSTDRQALGDHWLRCGLDEHASIAAFARAACDLLALGAPSHLVRAHLQAANDERRHARCFFELATRALRRPVGPGPLPLPCASAQRDAHQIALDVLRGGCINETLAALDLQLAALEVESAPLRARLLEIAADESRHAELAWTTFHWLARSHGLPPMRFGELDHAEADPGRPDVDLRPWGLTSRRGLDARRRQGVERVIRPALRAARARVPEITNALRCEL